MNVQLRETAFDPLRELAHYQQSMNTEQGKYGATVSFIGTMRDYNDDNLVQDMFLEHYPGMTERHLQRIVEEAGSRWKLLETLVIHRVGRLYPHDPIVLVAVWSAHRKDAFEACRHMMEALKSRAPFWKQESLVDGKRWVQHNTPG